jgi:hypothetical protein
MPELILNRTLSYVHASKDNPGEKIVFRRGIAQPVGPKDFEWLIGTGLFLDPRFNVKLARSGGQSVPDQLRGLTPGTAVAVHRAGGLGDMLLSMLGARELVLDFPELKVGFTTQTVWLPLLRDASFFAFRCSVDQLGDVGPQIGATGRTVFMINLQGLSETEHREQLDRSDLFCRHMTGHGIRNYDYPIYRRREEEARGGDIIGRDERPVLGICPNSVSPDRSWPALYVDRLIELAAAAGWHTATFHHRLVDSTHAMKKCGTANTTGRLTAPDFLCAIQAVDVMVSPDTGTTHLCEALKIKCVSPFTTVEPAARLVGYKYVRALWAALPCSPCYHDPCRFHTDADFLPRPCAKAIGPHTVWREVQMVHSSKPGSWALEAEFTPLPVVHPEREPVKPREKVIRLVAAMEEA